MTLGPYAAYIVACYAIAIAVVAGLILWIVFDHRRLRRTLADLDAHGVTRRSDPHRQGPHD